MRLTPSKIFVWELVKVTGVVDGADLNGDSSWTLADVLPVHIDEEGVFAELFQSPVGAKTRLRIGAQRGNQVVGLLGDGCLRGKSESLAPRHHILIGLVRRRRTEWRETCDSV